MKLSEALEFCIEKQFYSTRAAGFEFMCHALDQAGLGEHVPAVMKMVKTINPNSYALASALGLSGKGMSHRKSHGICKVHYIKWIAELKEQGL